MSSYIYLDRRTYVGLSAIAALLFLYLALDGYLENRAFRQHGKVAVIEPGSTISQHTVEMPRTTLHGPTQATATDVEVTFTTEDGRKVAVNKPLPPYLNEQLRNGSRVEILYVSTHPEKTRFQGDDDQNVSAALILGLASLGAFFLLTISGPRGK